MLERMADFFEKRLAGYDEHMLTEIYGAAEFYHYDTPLTVEHEVEILKNAGFKRAAVLKNWGATYTLRADK